MGVPLFFKKLNEKYNIVRSNPDKRIKSLYIDTNCLLHPQCFAVLELYKNITNHKKLFRKMVDRIIRYIDYLIRLTNPTDLVYLAIDGVAPLAKVNQQRMRRFGYTNNYRNEINKKYGIPINDSWSNIVITPGTDFMYNLHNELITYYTNKYNNNKTESFELIYDSYKTYGEGEHKILQHIKNTHNIDKNKNDDAIVIYGLDADLVFLAMASQIPNIYLLRETSHYNNDKDNDIDKDMDNIEQELCYADIDFAKNSINNEFNEYYTRFITLDNDDNNIFGNTDSDNVNNIQNIQDTNKLSHDFTNDYIFICFFLGNDFLPHLPSIDIAMDGLDILLSAYIEIFQLLGRNLITFDKNKHVLIDNEFLTHFIILIASKEEDFFKRILPEALRRHNRKRCYEYDAHKIDIWEIENLKNVSIEDKIKLGYGEPKEWKGRYYSHYFKTSEHMDEMIGRVCHTYLEGLVWVAKYYFEECHNWRWQYKFTHAPFLSDISRYIKNKDINTFNTSSNPPIDIYTQLVSIIPSAYSSILPQPLRYFSNSMSSPIIDLYPIRYDIDMINKTQLYKCVPIIPYLDISRVESCVNKVKLSDSDILIAKKSEPIIIKSKSDNVISPNITSHNITSHNITSQNITSNKKVIPNKKRVVKKLVK